MAIDNKKRGIFAQYKRWYQGSPTITQFFRLCNINETSHSAIPSFEQFVKNLYDFSFHYFIFRLFCPIFIMAIVSLVLKDTQWLLRMETQGQILNILYFISIADIKIGPLDISWPLLYILYFSTIKALCIFQLVDKTVLITAKALLVLQFGMFLLMSLHAFAVAPYNPSVSSF